MIDDVKGYVVRGTWDTGPVVCHVPGGFWHDRSPHVFREIEYARSQRGLMLQQGCTDVSIFRIHADGREERLPSYEEALAHLAAVREALAITPGETATGAARRTAAELVQAREEIERLRGLIGAFTRRARIRSDADGWCNLAAELQPFEALQQEPEGRVS